MEKRWRIIRKNKTLLFYLINHHWACGGGTKLSTNLTSFIRNSFSSFVSSEENIRLLKSSVIMVTTQIHISLQQRTRLIHDKRVICWRAKLLQIIKSDYKNRLTGRLLFQTGISTIYESLFMHNICNHSRLLVFRNFQPIKRTNRTARAVCRHVTTLTFPQWKNQH